MLPCMLTLELFNAVDGACKGHEGSQSNGRGGRIGRSGDGCSPTNQQYVGQQP